jgi:hypothetical protein
MSIHHPRRRTLRYTAGAGIAALTMLGVTVAGTGTASANNMWKIQIINANVPSGTGSVQIKYNNTGYIACHALTSGSKTTETGGTMRADYSVTLTPFGGSTCAGSVTGAGATYMFSADQDVRENNINCQKVALGVNTAEHAFRICA